MTRKIYFTALVFAGILLFSASTMASETDRQIEDAAKNSYVFKNYLQTDILQVNSKDGVVALTGEVESDHDKTLAESEVSGLPGVVSVNNQLQLKATAPRDYSDAWIAAKIKTILLFHRNVSSTKTQVEVKDGVVTLSGETDSAAQKDLTAKYAQDVDGVKKLVNNLNVVSPKPEEGKEGRSLKEKIDDVSITAEIKVMLLAHHSTSALKTKVHTEDGVVTVEGEAKNPAEKDLVTELIRDMRGVKDVNNHMTTE